MNTPTYGVGPNGRALKKDGTERKERVKLTAIQRMAKEEEAAKNRRAGVGREVLSTVDSLAAFRSGIGKVRGYSRTAAEFNTEDKRAAKRSWAEDYLASIEERGEIAEAYEASCGDILDRIASIEADIGTAVFAFIKDNVREPDAAEALEIASECISEEDMEFMSAASEPENDPFAKFRRDADTDTDSSDTL